MEIPPRDFQGTVGTVENLLLVFHGFHRPVFSTASLHRLPGHGREELPRSRIATYQVGAEAD